jgi:multiple sugar transport system substrate-binding protein
MGRGKNMKKIDLNRRQFLKFTALAGGAAVLAACTPAGSPPAAQAPAAGDAAAPAAEGAVVSYWYAWGNFDPAMEIISGQDQFKEHMGGTTLDFKGTTNQDALLTAIAGGTPPDAGSNYSYPNLHTRGATIPVGDWVEASSVIKQDDILDPLWRSAFIDGQMIGVPAIESYLWWGLNYNAQAAADAGLDADAPPATWDEALEWHKALTKKDAAGNLLQIGLDPYDAMAGEPDFAATSWGFKWYDEETQTFDLANPLMAESMDVMGEFYRIAGPDQFAGLRQAEGQGGWGAAYNAGVQHMIIEGYWHPGETQIQKPEVAQFNKATWAPVPVARAGAKVMATGAHFVMIFKDGKNHEGAFKLGEYLNTAPALDVIFENVGWVHGVKSWLTTVDASVYPGLDFYISAATEATDFVLGRRCPIQSFVISQYQELREQVFRDLMDPQAAADELQARALAEWEAQGLGNG